MEKPQEQFEHAGFTIKIHQDIDAQSPEQWGNESLFLVAFAPRYLWVVREGLRTHEDAEAWADHFHIFPVRAYIHSGVVLSLSDSCYPFNDPWDSGWIGFALASKEEWSSPAKAREAAESLVAEWNQFLCGDVWGYKILDSKDEDSEMDSCWGFYGLDYCMQEARGVAEALAKERQAQLDEQSKLYERLSGSS